MEQETLVSDIVAREWEMFQKVQNRGGEADCQHKPTTFALMRRSQLATWSLALLQSYREDLRQAKAQGRNLMSEKYAWMMRETAPEDFAQLAEQLPNISPETWTLIERIVAIHVAWHKEVAAQYPCLLSHGRPSQALGHMTSLATYLRGELATYSLTTLTLYKDLLEAKVKRGKNEARDNLLNQVRYYGFESLEACEAHLASKKAH